MSNTVIPYSVLIFLLSISMTLISLRVLIPKLRGYAKQPIYEGGPTWHMVKSGTPTLGGAAFLFSFFAVTLVMLFLLPNAIEAKDAQSIALLALFSILNGAIGILDDITKLKRAKNLGLTAWQKLLLQSLLAILFLTLRAYLFDDGTSMWIFNIEIRLGVFYYPISLILILGAVNCANLTDGIDGLLASVGLIGSAVLTVISLYAAPAFALVSVSLLGITLGFLFYNVAPAKIFMGDTGSLFIGALIISTLYSLKRPEYFISIGAVFIVEGVSVILQVLFFKLRGRRLFLMSPLHHHLERKGYSETRICVMAIILTLLASLPVLIREVL